MFSKFLGEKNFHEGKNVSKFFGKKFFQSLLNLKKTRSVS